MATPIELQVRSTLDRFVADFERAAMSNVTATIGQAINDFANSRTARSVIEFAEQLKKPINQADILDAHDELKDAMQDATRRSYAQHKRNFRPAIYDPPRSSRMKKNALEEALGNPDFAEATAKGINFGNVALLDRTARQWYRLNFGAAPTGQGSSDRFTARFSNLPPISFTFENAPDAGYGLPVGGFKGPDGKFQKKGFGIPTGAFYPKRGSRQEFPTKGNRGYYFLDTGVARFFDLLPQVYGDLFQTIVPFENRQGRPATVAETHHTRLQARR